MFAVERLDLWSHNGFELGVSFRYGGELNCAEPGDWGTSTYLLEDLN